MINAAPCGGAFDRDAHMFNKNRRKKSGNCALEKRNGDVKRTVYGAIRYARRFLTTITLICCIHTIFER